MFYGAQSEHPDNSRLYAEPANYLPWGSAVPVKELYSGSGKRIKPRPSVKRKLTAIPEAGPEIREVRFPFIAAFGATLALVGSLYLAGDLERYSWRELLLLDSSLQSRLSNISWRPMMFRQTVEAPNITADKHLETVAVQPEADVRQVEQKAIAAPVPAPSPLIEESIPKEPASISDLEAEQFAANFLRLLSENNFSELAKFYADEVSYFQLGTISKDSVIAQLVKAQKRLAGKKLELIDSKTFAANKTGDVAVTSAEYRELDSGSSQSSGSLGLLVLKLKRFGPDLRIIAENGTVKQSENPPPVSLANVKPAEEDSVAAEPKRENNIPSQNMLSQSVADTEATGRTDSFTGSQDEASDKQQPEKKHPKPSNALKSVISLCRSYMQAKRFQEAERLLKQALRASNSEPQLHYLSAVLHSLNFNRSEGLKALARAVELRPAMAGAAARDAQLDNLRSARFYGILEEAQKPKLRRP